MVSLTVERPFFYGRPYSLPVNSWDQIDSSNMGLNSQVHLFQFLFVGASPNRKIIIFVNEDYVHPLPLAPGQSHQDEKQRAHYGWKQQQRPTIGSCPASTGSNQVSIAIGCTSACHRLTASPVHAMWVRAKIDLGKSGRVSQSSWKGMQQLSCVRQTPGHS